MWAPLVGPQRYDSEGTRAVGYDMLDPTIGQSLGSAFKGDWWEWTGTGSLLRMGEMDDALGQTPQVYGKGGIYPQRQRTPIDERQWKEGPSYREGLSYFDGMTEEAAGLLAERHDERTRREDILSRTQGYGINSLVLATRLAAQVADPIGIAASFIPVVGEARYAKLLAQLGRPGARAVAGAIEGAVGNALLEPLVYAAARQDQIDYGMVDSLINVGIGGLFGAGLRAGGGAVADLIARRGGARAATAAADTAIVQAASGREIDVRPVLRAAEEQSARSNGASRTSMEVNGRTVVDVGERAPQDIPDAVAARQAAERRLVERDREVIRRGLQEDALKPRTLEQRRADAYADLLDAYPSREIVLPSGKSVTRKGPIDLATFMRAVGGIQDAPELRGFDIPRKPRDVQFAKGEQFLGALIRNDGMTLEQAVQRAADAGYIGRTFSETNEYGESGVRSQATTEEFVDALNRTLAAGENLEGRVWGIGDDDQPLRDYFLTMRDLDEEEAFTTAGEERWQPLTDEDVAADDGMFGDADGLDAVDDPEALWREEMERDAANRAQPADDPQAAAKPRAEGEPKPLTPEQEIELDAERYRAGVEAAAACMARTL